MLSTSALDDLLPHCDWRSASTLWVAAAPALVVDALRKVSMAQLPGATANQPQRPAGSGRERGRKPLTLLAELLEQGYFVLHEQAGDIVLGRISRFWRPGSAGVLAVTGRQDFVEFTEPGFAKVTLAWQVRPVDPPRCGAALSLQGAPGAAGADGSAGCLVCFECRMVSSDGLHRRELSRRQLVGQWATHPGRAELLWAVKRRAEAATVETGRPSADRPAG